jgi:hypothetical protein
MIETEENKESSVMFRHYETTYPHRCAPLCGQGSLYGYSRDNHHDVFN